MKIKLDENLGERGRRMFADAGHDVATVKEEGLEGESDRLLIQACGNESRCFVTLDLDFSNTLVFPPEDYAGICVLRPPRRFTPEQLFEVLRSLLSGLDVEPAVGKL